MAEMCQGNATGGCKAKAKKGDLGEENSPAYMNGGRQFFFFPCRIYLPCGIFLTASLVNY